MELLEYDMQIGQLRPNDTLVVRTTHGLTEEAIKRIKSGVKDQFGSDRRILVIDSNAELSILRSEDPSLVHLPIWLSGFVCGLVLMALLFWAFGG